MPHPEDFLPTPPELGPPLPRFLELGWPWVSYGPWQTWSVTLSQLQRPETPFAPPGITGEFVSRQEALRLPPLLARGFPFFRDGRAT